MATEMLWRVVSVDEKVLKVLFEGRLLMFQGFVVVIDEAGNISTGDTVHEAVSKYLRLVGRDDLVDMINNHHAFIEVG